MLLKVVLSIIMLLLAFPIGILLASLTKEELKTGEKWFYVIIILSILVAVFSLFISDLNLKLSILLTNLFIIIVTGISIKSKYL